jgi:hypothetical protein
LKYLKEKGIFSLGTIRKDRLYNNPFPSTKEFEKKPRGSMIEFVSGDEKISSVLWNDNSAVLLVSTLTGSEPVSTIKRWNKKEREYSNVTCPDVVKVYNKHMGGVDLMDSHIGRFRIQMKSKKWYFRLFYHILDLAIINAWLLSKNKVPNMTQKQFRIDIGHTLCNIGRSTNPKRGRPSSVETIPKKVKKSAAPRPSTDIRKDETGHWPIYSARQRCKLSGCTGKSFIMCNKCKLNFCPNNTKNCFLDFHKK